ncbi:hypothetical protein V1524DRAFT_428400 [Lipomyces starkeyi]
MGNRSWLGSYIVATSISRIVLFTHIIYVELEVTLKDRGVRQKFMTFSLSFLSLFCCYMCTLYIYL